MARKVKIDNRINTNKKITEAPICNNCPARIYQPNDAILKYGKGNLLPNYVFVLPPDAITNKWYEKYFKMITDDLIDINVEYITYHPKCIASSPVEEYGAFCTQYLMHEIRKLKPKKVIFFGVSIPTDVLSLSYTYGIEIYRLNNLLSIYYGEEKVSEFINKLKQIL